MATSSHLEQGRSSYKEGAWLHAFEALSSTDGIEPLGAVDLERLAHAAYMLGRDADYIACLERAHHAHMAVAAVPPAARCGFWIGHSLVFRGEKARGAGWFARTQRLLDGFERDCVERGYLLIPIWLGEMGRGDFEAGYATAVRAAEIGETFGDADLVWLARDDQARALMRLGRVEEGLRLVDEALVAATTGDLSPMVTGIVFCNTIGFCRAVYQLRHVQEWTTALTGWCERQPEMVAHNGLCLVHRAEILLLTGEWEKALQEAKRSSERFTLGALNQLASGRAFYCQGEAHRLRGDFVAAEEAYRLANERGCEPQPGLALLRLAQGNGEAAAASIRRMISETTAPLARAGVLPAYVEITLALGSREVARAACEELDEIANRFGSEVLSAMASQSRGALALAEGRASDALVQLRQALGIWTDLAAPYEAARVRARVGQACRALEDRDTADLELRTARAAFADLGAAPDLARLEELERKVEPTQAHGLTPREIAVLRLVAAGSSNRDIAKKLFISEHTVARHLQNIFAKLAVTSRTAATAFAFEHELV